MLPVTSPCTKTIIPRNFNFEVPSQFVLGYPALPLDRAFLFPMAVVPHAWGPWNMLHLALRSRVRLPVGILGSLLVLIRHAVHLPRVVTES